MKKQKKQNILTFIIVILVLILVTLIISIIYEEKINMSKHNAEDVISSEIEENEKSEEIEDEVEYSTVEDEEEKQQIDEVIGNEEPEYVGEEEQQLVPENENPTQSKDEKAIELAQNEWGNDDSVSFNVEEKKGDIYYVAVKSDAVVIQWYEVDTVTWEISEYY